MILPAVFTASLSSLFYEILLSYYFAEAQWNNLYFFVISISLFGYSAGGLIINLMYGRIKKDRSIHVYSLITACLFILSVGVLFSYLAVNYLRIDYFRIPFEKRLIGLLILQYCILAIPFTAAGTIIAAAFSSPRIGTHRVYTASMSGSAAGVLLAFLIIPAAGAEAGIIFCALLPVLSRCLGKKIGIPQRAVAGLSAAGFVVLYLLGPSLLKPIPSSYKPLSSMLASKGTRLLESHHSIHGRIDIVESPSSRTSPGLSLNFRGEIPAGRAAVLNAGRTVMLYNLQDDLTFTSFCLPAAAKAVQRPVRNALIIEKGEGTALPLAVSVGLQQIDVFEPIRELADILSRNTAPAGLRIMSRGARSPHISCAEGYDLIYIDDPGSPLPGFQSLDEQFHLTTEAFTWYLETLSEKGMIILTRNLLLPPTDSVRLFSTVLQALEHGGIQSPGNHMIMIRNWNTYTILASKSRFTFSECLAIREFADTMNFDVVYYPGIRKGEINRFNVFAEPYHHQAVMGVFAGEKTLFNTKPTTDARPYAYSFLSPGSLKEQSEAVGSRRHIILTSGDILAWILLGAALVVALGFLVVPVLTEPEVRKKIRPTAACYFSLLGLAFMFVETGFIKLFTLPTGDSLVSFSLVLSVILIISAAGSYAGRHIGQKKLLLLSAVLSGVLCGIALFGFQMVKGLMDWGGVPLYAGLILLAAIPGYAMGVPFPAGLRLFAPSPPERAYSWAANGVFSVLSSILAVPVSLYAGIPALFATAGAAYLSAGLLTLALSSNR